MQHQSGLTNVYEYAPLSPSAIIPKKLLWLPKTAIGALLFAAHTPHTELVSLVSHTLPASFSNIEEKSGRPCLKSSSYSGKMCAVPKPHSAARRAVIVCIFSRTSLCTSSPECEVCSDASALHEADCAFCMSEIAVSYTHLTLPTTSRV